MFLTYSTADLRIAAVSQHPDRNTEFLQQLLIMQTAQSNFLPTVSVEQLQTVSLITDHSIEELTDTVS